MPAALPPSVSRLSTAIVGALALLTSAGCAGRAEFARGLAFFDRGEYRSAYREFWEAYRLRPVDHHYDACRRAAARVAAELVLDAREFEARGKIDAAVRSYALAFEYDDRSGIIRDGLARVRWQAEELARLRWDAESAPRGTWGEFDRCLRLMESPFADETTRSRAATRAREIAHELARKLRDVRIPADAAPAEIARGRLAWTAFAHECRLRVWAAPDRRAEHEPWFELVRREEEIHSILSPLIDEADGEVKRLDRMLAARACLAESERSFGDGEYVAALRESRRARLLCPAVPGGTDLEKRCREAMRRPDESTTVEGTIPSSVSNAGAFDLADAEQPEWLSLSRRTALRVLELRRSSAESSRVAESLLAELHAWVEPRFRVELPRLSRAARDLQRDLWGLDEWTFTRVRSVLAAATETWDDTATSDRLRLEDLEFSVVVRPPAPGLEIARFVDELKLVTNPEFQAIAADLEAARAELADARESLGGAAAPGVELAVEVAKLAEWRVSQLEKVAAGLKEAVADVRWEESSYETSDVELLAVLAGRLVGDDDATGGEWISVESTFVDRESAATSEFGIPGDARELPTRGEMALGLASALRRKISRRLGEMRRERLEALLARGEECLETGRSDAAAEAFARVYLGSRAADSRAERLRRRAGARLFEILDD